MDQNSKDALVVWAETILGAAGEARGYLAGLPVAVLRGRAGSADILPFGLRRKAISARIEIALPSFFVIARLKALGQGTSIAVEGGLEPAHQLLGPPG